MDIKGRKILLMGLGILGGGAATAKWLLEQGAILTITDLKDPKHLKPSLEKLKEYGNKIKFVLEKHREKDFLENDVIVINPDVPSDNKFVQLAKKNGKQIENELTLFYKFSRSKNILAITGTRGKTTTANWTAHFLKSHDPNTLLIGNSPDKPFLHEIGNVNGNSPVVLEVPSYHLEIVDRNNFRPRVAVITNIYRDHINRHKSMREYALTKANIFKGQTKDDFLILDKNDEWTKFFMNLNPKSKVLFPSDQTIFSKKESMEFIDKLGEHNFKNMLMALQAALISNVSVENIRKSLSTLPQIKFREEKIYDNGKIQIYNDTAATSPDATIAGLKRFADARENLVLISGGTDRELEFKTWAESVKNAIAPNHLILLSGSATEKMKKELGWSDFQEFGDLQECLNKACKITSGLNGKSIILFSPGAKSFEKFKNEFDRGEQFNLLVSEIR